MRAGLLRERITVLEVAYVETAQTTEHEYHTIHDNVPCRVVHLHGSKQVEAEEVVTDFSLEFHVRQHYINVIKPTMVIVYREQRYAILNLAHYPERQELIITAKTIENEELY